MIRHVESSEIILYLAEKNRNKHPLVGKKKPITVAITDVYKYGIAMERKDPAVQVIIGPVAYEKFSKLFPGVSIKAKCIKINDISSSRVAKDVLRYGPTASTRDILRTIRINRKK